MNKSMTMTDTAAAFCDTIETGEGWAAWLSALTGSAVRSFDAALVLIGLCVPLLMLVRRMIAAGSQGRIA